MANLCGHQPDHLAKARREKIDQFLLQSELGRLERIAPQAVEKLLFGELAFLDLAAADDSNVDTDNVTNQTTGLTISGSAETGATVSLFDDVNNNGVMDGGESVITTTVAAGGTFSADIALAEPRAMIGFAGPRVIRETTHQELPEGFQTAEFLLEHGLIDEIVPRAKMRETIITIIGHLTGK